MGKSFGNRRFKDAIVVAFRVLPQGDIVDRQKGRRCCVADSTQK